MNRRKLCRPSLRITQSANRIWPSQLRFEVWNPFLGTYQVLDSVDDATKRVGELADLICRMWLQRHPKRDALADVPDALATDGSRWAEFRINATTFRSYDTRNDGRPAWTKATGMVQAVTAVCARVGCAHPMTTA